MNRFANIALLIIGIVCLAFPPLGMIVLLVAYASHRIDKERTRGYRKAMAAKQAQKDRRALILAYKSLP